VAFDGIHPSACDLLLISNQTSCRCRLKLGFEQEKINFDPTLVQQEQWIEL